MIQLRPTNLAVVQGCATDIVPLSASPNPFSPCEASTTCRLRPESGGIAIFLLTFLISWSLLGNSPGLSLAVAVASGLGVKLYLSELARRQAAKSYSRLMGIFHSTLRCLAAAIDARDYYGQEHVSLVEFVSCEVAREMGLSAEEVEGIRTAALLSDVGTLGIPENILLQTGRPSATEFTSIHNHPIIGAQILESVPFPWAVQKIIRSHHERWDGAGYPDRLSATEIPLGARILAVADVYGALTCNRAYRSSWTHKQAMDHIVKQAGLHFDPEVVTAFAEIEQRILSSRRRNDSRSAELASSTISRANQQFVALWEISRTAESSLELKSMLAAVARKIADVLHCDGCAIFLADATDGAMVCQAACPSDLPDMIGLRVSGDDTGTGRVAREQHPLITRASAEHLVAPDGQTVIVPCDSVAIAPLRTDDTFLGTVNLYRTDKEFTIEELDLLDTLARHASVSVANASLYQATRESADRDPLTGLYNLRYFCAQMEQELARADRLGREFSIIAIDLDRFKAVNDTLGHPAGDALLRDVARIFTQAVRDYDTVVRYGGDEFVIVLPEATAEDAQETVSRLHAAVTAYISKLPGLRAIGFAASAGIATFPLDGRDAKSLLSIADRRMYEHKRLSGAARAAA